MRLPFIGPPRCTLPETTARSDFCKPPASHCYTENMRNRHEQGGSELKPAPDGEGAGSLIPDVLTDGLSVVFCGSALGDVSWERRAYYANPGNRFWQTLAEVGLTPRRLAVEEYPWLIDWRIGPVSYTHLRAHETRHDIVCRLLLEK